MKKAQRVEATLMTMDSATLPLAKYLRVNDYIQYNNRSGGRCGFHGGRKIIYPSLLLEGSVTSSTRTSTCATLGRGRCPWQGTRCKVLVREQVGRRTPRPDQMHVQFCQSGGQGRFVCPAARTPGPAGEYVW